ncbi:hypothetical protein F5878DRAFT_647813, partial [Lentinula raphanica]
MFVLIKYSLYENTHLGHTAKGLDDEEEEKEKMPFPTVLSGTVKPRFGKKTAGNRNAPKRESISISSCFLSEPRFDIPTQNRGKRHFLFLLLFIVKSFGSVAKRSSPFLSVSAMSSTLFLLTTESKAVISGRRRCVDLTPRAWPASAFSILGVRMPTQLRANRTTSRYRLFRLAALSLYLSPALTMSRVVQTPSAPFSGDLPLLYTVRIILRLRALRTSLELSACPPQPPLDADENFLGLSIYPGSMTEVTSQDDRNFGSLGHLFFIIEKRLNERDPELNDLLLLRNTSILHSTAVVADTDTDPSVSSSNDTQVPVASADAENDESGHSQPNGRAERKHAPYYIPHRRDRLPPSHVACEMPKGITVTILAWSK